MINADKTCDRCGDRLAEIRIIDKAEGWSHNDVEYALADAKRGMWTGQFPLEGKVKAFMCPMCGRIFHFGSPKSEE